MSNIVFISNTSSFRSNTYLAAMLKSILSASVAKKVVCVYNLLSQGIDHPVYLITYPVLDLTNLISSHVSFYYVPAKSTSA